MALCTNKLPIRHVARIFGQNEQECCAPRSMCAVNWDSGKTMFERPSDGLLQSSKKSPKILEKKGPLKVFPSISENLKSLS